MSLDFLHRIVEERIAQAEREGQFDNLKGRGQPLPPDDDSHVPEDLRMAFRILRNAGCLPPELEVRHEIVRLRDLLDAASGEERAAAARALNLKILQFNMMRPRHLSLEASQVLARAEVHRPESDDL
jgi:hypothetical protein